MDDSKQWRVLVLSAGYGNETIRDQIRAVVSELGFVVTVYDRPGYPVSSLMHSHAACIEAIDHHDIIVALIDEKEGAPLQLDQIPAGLKSELLRIGVIADDYGTRPLPTILQVEILTAKAKGKSVISLVPESVKTLCYGLLSGLPGLISQITPRTPESPSAKNFIDNRKWTELHENHVVPTSPIPFGQLAFLERLRHETPNYISYFGLGNFDELAGHLKARLASLPLELIKSNLSRAESRLLRKRTPVAWSQSLAWLREHRLVISGPYISDTGAKAEQLPLLEDGHSVALPHYLSEGRSLALVGDPGMGKSTYLLLAIIDYLRDTDGRAAVLFASWRELPQRARRDSAEYLIRTLIGLSSDRSIWPDKLPLPAIRWCVVLDGLDESEVDLGSLQPLLEDLRSLGALLVSCRAYDFDRRLFPIQGSFESIMRLLPWGKEELDEYRTVLTIQGDERTAEYLDSHKDDYRSVLSVPLWLTMITFLSRRSTSMATSDEVNDYELLENCLSAVAGDELTRNGRERENDLPQMRRAWLKAAWEIFLSRRHGGQLSESALRESLSISGDRMWKACRSLLDERNGAISGFVHETFFEYWLAENIISAMMAPHGESARLADVLSFQRSVATNRLVRQGAATSSRAAYATAALREAFWQAADEQTFAKNQILYFLGRIDRSLATIRFLTAIWCNKTEHDFVRYSAAHAATALGIHSIEAEFYSALRIDNSFDRMNLWYHRSYYGDVQADEGHGYDLDDGTGSAGRAVQQLIERLHRRQSRHLNLRRIDLLTLRRFIERGERVDSSILEATFSEIENDLLVLTDRESYAEGVRVEIAKIRELLG